MASQNNYSCFPTAVTHAQRWVLVAIWHILIMHSWYWRIMLTFSFLPFNVCMWRLCKEFKGLLWLAFDSYWWNIIKITTVLRFTVSVLLAVLWSFFMMVFSYWKLNALQSPFLCVQCGGQSPFTHPVPRHSLWNSQNTTSAGMGGNTSLDSSKEAASSESKGRWILPDHVRWCSCFTFISKSWDAGGKLKLLQRNNLPLTSRWCCVCLLKACIIYHLTIWVFYVSTAAGLQVTETVCL